MILNTTVLIFGMAVMPFLCREGYGLCKGPVTQAVWASGEEH